MSAQFYFQAAAAVYLLGAPVFITAAKWHNRLLFKVLPLLIGAGLAFHTYADFMGWRP